MENRQSVMAGIAGIVFLVIITVLGVLILRTIRDLSPGEGAGVMPTAMPTAAAALQLAETAVATQTPTPTAILPQNTPSPERDAAVGAPAETPTTSAATQAPLVSPSPAPADAGRAGGEFQLLYLSRNWNQNTAQLRVLDPSTGTSWLMGSVAAERTKLLDWSQDGKWALVRGLEGTFAWRTDGSQEERIVSRDIALNGAWSPTAAQAALATYEELFLVDVATGEQKTIPLPITAYSPPNSIFGLIGTVSWAPDGSWFAWQMIGVDEAGRQTAGLYRYVVASGAVETLYEDRAFVGRMQENYFARRHNYPVVSPDGRFLLTNLAGKHSIYRLALDSGELVEIMRSYVPVTEPPRWSPDGEWIAAVFRQDIYLMRPDGAEITNLTNTPNVIERHVDWSPDGRMLAYSVQTVLGVRELALYDVASGQSTRLTHNSLQARSQDDVRPLWGRLASDSIATLPPPLPTPISDPAELTEIPLPPLPPITPTVSLEPPPLSLDPPWWGNRYFYRRPLVLSTDSPIATGDSRFVYPPLAQLAFDPALIREQLEYPVRGHDLHVVYWNGERWRDLPRQVVGLDGETAVLTFPLAGGSDGDYYLYYGSQARLQRYEGSPELGTVWISPSDVSSDEEKLPDEVKVAAFYSLQPDTEGMAPVGEVSWETGADNRQVLQLGDSNSVDLRSPFHLGQGSIGFFVKPASASRGQLLSVLVTREEELSLPLLAYDGGSLKLTLAGHELAAPVTWQPGQWHYLLVTWQAHEAMRLWVNGELLAEAPYPPTAEMAAPTWYLSRAQVRLGAREGSPGFAGSYSNLFASSTAFTPAQAVAFYQAQAELETGLGEAEAAVTTATITAEGGRLRSPDGNTWVDFPPNVVTEATAVSFVGLNPGESSADFIARFSLFPTDVGAMLSQNPDPWDELRSLYAEQRTAAPFQIFFRYDDDRVEWADTLVVVYFDELATETYTIDGEVYEEQGAWQPFPVMLAEEETVGLATGLTGWGSYTIAKNLGLGPR